jgi:hypothetical protein
MYATAFAAFNPEVNYQGKLTNSANVAVADGAYHMRFKLYTAETGGTSVHTEDRSNVAGNRIAVSNGLFSAMIGSSSPITAIDWNQPLWLEVEVGGTASSSWETLTPRKRLGAVPAAFVADTLDGINSTQFVRADAPTSIASTSASTLLTITQSGTGDILNLFDGASEVFTVLDGGNVGIGSSSPSAKLTVEGGLAVSGTVTATNLVATGTLTVSGLSSLQNASTTNLTIANRLYDGSNSAGQSGYVLQSTGTGVVWVATTTLGFGGGGASTFLALTDTPSSFTSNRIPFTNAGATALTDSANFVFTGTNLGIGSTSPIAELVVASANPSFIVDDNDAASTQLEFVASGATAYIRSGVDSLDTAARFRVVRSGTTATNIANFDIYASTTFLNGALGIGTTTPQSEIVVHDASGDSIIAISGSNSSNRGIQFNLLDGSPSWSFLMDTNEDLVLREFRSGNDDFRIQNTAGTDLIFLDTSAGTFGIGTSTPASTLTVSGSGLFTGNLQAANITATGTLGVSGLATFGNATFTNATTSMLGLTGVSVNGVLYTNANGTVLSTTSLSDALVADNITVSNGTITGGNISGTLITTGTLTIGDGGDRIDINSSGWDVTNSVITGATWNGATIGTLYGGTGVTATPQDGELLIGDGLGYTLSTLTAGAGISITNGAGAITITNASTTQWGTNGSSIYYNGGNVGIGTSSPFASLQIASATTPYLALTNMSGAADAKHWLLSNSGDNIFRIGQATDALSATSTKLLIDSSRENFYVGSQVGTSTGIGNIAIGAYTLFSNTTGSSNNGLGDSTLYGNTTGSNNNAFGPSALLNNTTGSYNNALGISALQQNTTGSNNNALGNQSLSNNTTGSNNIGIGQLAGYTLTTGTSTTFLGAFADASSATLSTSTALGAGSVVGCSNCLTLGGTGQNYTRVGIGTSTPAWSLQIASATTPYLALTNMSGDVDAKHWILSNSGDNIFRIGQATDAFTGTTTSLKLDTGNSNYAVGYYALANNTDGGGNIAFGDNSLVNNISGSYSTAIGHNALPNNYSSYNTALGYRSLFSNSYGENNIGIGQEAGSNITTGTSTTFLGAFANASSATLSTSTALGAGSVVGCSNCLTLGGTGQNYTRVGIGTSTPAWSLQIASATTPYLALTNMSGAADAKHWLLSNSGDGIFRIGQATDALSATSTKLLIDSANNNFYVGTQVGTSTGYGNNALGENALFSNTTGSGNNAFGYRALFNNTSGTYNNALGENVLLANTTGSNNNALGNQTLRQNTSGEYNNAIGYNALRTNTTGRNNNAIGQYALYENTTGASNNALGFQALYQGTTGSNNIGIGESAGVNNTTGWGNIALGTRTYFPTAAGNQQLNIGNILYGSLPATSTSFQLPTSGGIGIGSTSPMALLTIHGNQGDTRSNLFVIGSTSGSGATTTLFAVANTGALTVSNSATSSFSGGLSTGALQASSLRVTGGVYDSLNSSGTNGMVLQTTGAGAVWVATSTLGLGAGGSNFFTNSGDNTYLSTGSRLGIGTSTPAWSLQIASATTPYLALTNMSGASGAKHWLLSNTGDNIFRIGQASDDLTSTTSEFFIDSAKDNFSVGENSLAANTSGDGNIALGWNSLSNNTSGWSNVAIGPSALSANISGVGNLSIGQETLNNNGTGSYNTAFGHQALSNNNSGSNNIGIGQSAGSIIVSGTSTTFLGAFADASSATLSTSTALGAGSIVGCSNCLTLGGTGQNYTRVGIGTSTPAWSLQIASATPYIALTDTDADDYARHWLVGNTNGVFTVVGAGGDMATTNTQVFGLDANNSNIYAGYTRLHLENTTGGQNIAFGDAALNFNADGTYNIALGSEALRNNTTGWTNIGLGRGALYNTESGSNNIGIGERAAYNNTTGWGNIAIGERTYFPTATGNRQLNIGNILYGSLPATSTSFQLPTSGGIGIGSTSPMALFTIHGNQGDTRSNLFVIGSTSGSGATTTLFAVANTGALIVNNSATSTFAAGASTTGLTTSFFRNTGAFYDANNSAGASSSVLLSTGSGARWFATSSLGFIGTSAIDTCAEFAAIITGETGTCGSLVLSASPTFTGTANFANASSTNLSSGYLAVGQTGTTTLTTNGYVLTNRLGIGTTTPYWTAQIASATTPYLALTNLAGTGNNKHYLLSNTGDGIFRIGKANDSLTTFSSSTKLLIDATNNNFIVGLQGGTSAGSSNNAFGNFAMGNNISGINNNALGQSALVGTTTGSVSGSDNNAFGSSALSYNASGSHNNALGYQALLRNESGSSNNALGYFSNYSNTTGSNNNAIGNSALFNNTTGQSNNALGYQTLFLNTTGSFNNAFGQEALTGNTEGFSNNAIGNSALYSNTTGSFNNALGESAGVNNTTGWGNIALGTRTYFPTAAGNQQLNIGNILYGSLPATSTQFQLPTTGGIGIGSSSPMALLTIHGNQGDTRSNLFVIGSTSGSGATTTLFSVANTGALTVSNSATSSFSGGLSTGALQSSSLRVTGGVYDTNNTRGTSGMVLQTTGTGVQWVATSTLGLGAGGSNFFTNSGDNTYLSTGSNLGVGTTTPWGQLSVNPNGISGPSFVIGSSTKTDFVVTNTGNVGIGSTNPLALLSVGTGGILDANVPVQIGAESGALTYFGANKGSTYGALFGYRNNSGGYTGGEIRIVGNEPLRMLTNDTERLRIDNSGNVGIGTTSPTTKLSILQSSGSVREIADFMNSSRDRRLEVVTDIAGDSISYTGINSREWLSSNPMALALQTGGVNRLYITSGGNVGIGTSSPTQKLEIYQSDIQLDNGQGIMSRLLGTNTSVTLIRYSGTNSTLIGANSEIALGGSVFLQPASTGDVFATLDADTDLDVGSGKLYVRGDNGNIGAGSSTPNWQLTLASSTPYLALSDTNAGTNAKNWLVGNHDGIFTIGTSTDNYSATTSLLTITNASTTFARALAVSSTGTSTFQNGINIAAGCFSVNGVCVTSGSGTNFFTNSGNDTYLSTGSKLGIGTSTPYWTTQIASATTPYLALTNMSGTSGAKHWLLSNSGDNIFRIGQASDGLSATSTKLLIDSANNNFYVGTQVGTSTGLYNTAIGYQALFRNTTGASNNALGFSALGFNTTGTYNNAIGDTALLGSTTAGQSGTHNNAFGYQSLYRNATGNYNNAFGNNALYYNTSGSDNNALGRQALQGSTTAGNSGSNNNAFGSNALTSNFSGTGNNAIGVETLNTNGTGNYNNAIGYQALYGNTSGEYNNALGYRAGSDITSGSANIVIGYWTIGGTSITTGSNNILLGQGVRAGLSQTGSNQLNIGNLIFGTTLGTDATFATGNLGVGTSSPFAKFTVVSSSTANETNPLFWFATTSSMTGSGHRPILWGFATTTGDLNRERVAIGTTSVWGTGGIRDSLTVDGRIYSTWRTLTCDFMGVDITTAITGDTTNTATLGTGGACGIFRVDEDTDGNVPVATANVPPYMRLEAGVTTDPGVGESSSLRTSIHVAAAAYNPVVEILARTPGTIGAGSYFRLAGFSDTAFGSDMAAEPSNGYYFAATSSNTWKAVTRSGSVSTVTDTGIATSSVNFQRLRIEASTNRVEFLINGTVVANHTTNISAGNVSVVMTTGITTGGVAGTAAQQRQMDIASVRLWVDDPPGEVPAALASTPEVIYDDVQAADLALSYLVGTTTKLISGMMVSNKDVEKRVTHTTAPYDSSVIGVVSTDPFASIGQSTASTTRVSLLGRAPVIVSLENGPIAQGDAIVASAIPGVGMKATMPGQIVGRALEAVGYSSCDEALGEELEAAGIELPENACVVRILSTIEPGFSLNVSSMFAEAATSTPSFATLAVELASSAYAQGASFTKFVIGQVNAQIAYIGSLFAEEVHTKKLCVADAAGNETCITKDQLDALLISSAGVPVPPDNGGDTGSGNGGSGNGGGTGGGGNADTEAPMIAVVGGTTVNITVGDTYADQGAVVTDNIDTSSAYTVSLDGGAHQDPSALSLDTSAPGTHWIEYRAVDAAGNVGTATRNIVVEAAPAPEPPPEPPPQDPPPEPPPSDTGSGTQSI